MGEYDSLWEVYEEANAKRADDQTADYWIYFIHEEERGKEVEINLPWADPFDIITDGKGHVPVVARSVHDARDKVEQLSEVSEVLAADYYDNGPSLEYLKEA